MKKQWIAKRRLGRTLAGEPIRVPLGVSRALLALGYIAEAPPVATAALLTPKRGYKRRDMTPAVDKDVVAETKDAVVELEKPPQAKKTQPFTTYAPPLEPAKPAPSPWIVNDKPVVE